MTNYFKTQEYEKCKNCNPKDKDISVFGSNRVIFCVVPSDNEDIKYFLFCDRFNDLEIMQKTEKAIRTPWKD